MSPLWSGTTHGRGQQFRLIFLSATKHNAVSSHISDYNSFIQARATAGHTDYSRTQKDSTQSAAPKKWTPEITPAPLAPEYPSIG